MGYLSEAMNKAGVGNTPGPNSAGIPIGPPEPLETRPEATETPEPPALLFEPHFENDETDDGAEGQTTEAGPPIGLDEALAERFDFVTTLADDTESIAARGDERAEGLAAFPLPVAEEPIDPNQQLLPFPEPEEVAQEIDDRLVAYCDPGSVMSEEYRGIRTRILARWENRTHLIHTITSATPKEGKTLTTLNLGVAFGELSDQRTVVVEGDLRVPMFRNMLKLPDTPGLIQVLRGDATLEEVVQESQQPNLFIIPAGGKVADEAIKLLSGPAMTTVLQRLRTTFDHVLVDTPPVLELADAGVLGAQSDDVLLIVRLNRTSRQLVDQATRTLTSYNAPVVGAILTDLPMHNSGYYNNSRYMYKYRYHYHRSEKRQRAMAA